MDVTRRKPRTPVTRESVRPLSERLGSATHRPGAPGARLGGVDSRAARPA